MIPEWKPIQTAPKNGHWILIYDEELGVVIGSYSYDKWRREPGGYPPLEKPHSWTSLPEPPKQ